MDYLLVMLCCFSCFSAVKGTGVGEATEASHDDSVLTTKETVNRMMEKMTVMQSEMNQLNSALQDEVKYLKVETFRLQTDLNGMKAENAKLQHEVNQLKVVNVKDQLQVGEAEGKQNQINQMQDEMNDLKAGVHIVNGRKAENIKLQYELNHLKATNIKLTNQVKANVSKMNERLADLEQLRAAQSNFVSFTAFATVTRNYNADQRVEFDGVVRNYGGHYDEFTSVFTCPATGYYQFGVYFFTKTVDMRASIRLNGTKLVSLFSAADYDFASNSVISLCETGQTVDVVCTANGKQLIGSDDVNERYSTFTGSLLQLIIE